MRLILRYLVRGLVVVIPAAITIWLLYRFFSFIDQLVIFPYPGIGFAVALAGVLLVGFLASNFVTRKLFEWTEALFVRAPIAKIIYTAIKDLIEAFVGDKRRFDRPVIVSLADTGMKILGFATREDVSFLGLADHVAVYFPQSYNFAGNVFLVPANRVSPVAIDPTRAMTFIVSGGVSGEEA